MGGEEGGRGEGAFFHYFYFLFFILFFFLVGTHLQGEEREN